MITIFKSHFNFKNFSLRIIFIIILISFFSNISYAQFKNKIFIAAGLSTVEIMGDNWGKLPILQRDTSKADIIGGGFTGPQTGFGLLLTMIPDEKENFRIPIGFDYYLYNAAQRVPYTRNITYQFHHDINVYNLNLGLNYVLLRLSLAEAKILTGIEARTSFISGQDFNTAIEDRTVTTPDKIIRQPAKANTVRLGGALRLGIEGHIYEQWYLNINYGIGVMNLLGNDNSRGELLTPKIDPEKTENKVWNFLFSFLLQYRL
jgi:hypothetical protein